MEKRKIFDYTLHLGFLVYCGFGIYYIISDISAATSCDESHAMMYVIISLLLELLSQISRHYIKNYFDVEILWYIFCFIIINMTMISWGIAEYLYDDCPPEWRLKHFATGVLIIQIIEFIIYVIMIL